MWIALQRRNLMITVTDWSPHPWSSRLKVVLQAGTGGSGTGSVCSGELFRRRLPTSIWPWVSFPLRFYLEFSAAAHTSRGKLEINNLCFQEEPHQVCCTELETAFLILTSRGAHLSKSCSLCREGRRSPDLLSGGSGWVPVWKANCSSQLHGGRNYYTLAQHTFSSLYKGQLVARSPIFKNLSNNNVFINPSSNSVKEDQSLGEGIKKKYGHTGKRRTADKINQEKPNFTGKLRTLPQGRLCNGLKTG